MTPPVRVRTVKPSPCTCTILSYRTAEHMQRARDLVAMDGGTNLSQAAAEFRAAEFLLADLVACGVGHEAQIEVASVRQRIDEFPSHPTPQELSDLNQAIFQVFESVEQRIKTCEVR